MTKSKHIVESCNLRKIQPYPPIYDYIILDAHLPPKYATSGEGGNGFSSFVQQSKKTQSSFIKALGLREKMTNFTVKSHKVNGAIALSGHDIISQNYNRSDGVENLIKGLLEKDHFSNQPVESRKERPQSIPLELDFMPSKISRDQQLPMSEDVKPTPKLSSLIVVVTAQISNLRRLEPKQYHAIKNTHEKSRCRTKSIQKIHRAMDIRAYINIGQIMAPFSFKNGIVIPHTHANRFSWGSELRDDQIIERH